MAGFEVFKLSELLLDQENYRTGPTTTQREALLAIIADQELKLVNLGEDLIDIGPSPGEPIWVTRDLKVAGMYVVLEGNRRVAALKLMENPAMAAGTVVEDGFKDLATRFAAKPIRQLEARMFDTREDAKPFQRRRHLSSASGVGLEPWKTIAKARANREQGQKAPRFLAVVELLQDESQEWAELAAALDSKWTTVDRVLNRATLPSVLGVSIDPKAHTITFENGEVQAGKALLRQMLHRIAAPGFEFKEIEKEEDRDKFISGFASSSVKATPASPGTPVVVITPNSTPISPSPSAPPKGPLNNPIRLTLAPKSGGKTFKVSGDRLNSIYKECRLVELKGHENAAALLLRVFIELSSEALLTERSVSIPPRLSRSGTLTKWDDIGIRLSDKVGCVLELIDPSGKDKKLQTVRVARDPSSHAVYSISTLHGYFHNRDLKPDSTAIREAWDGWEHYLRMLHGAR